VSSHGQSFINSLAYLPPNSSYPEGLIISGGKDTIIEVRQPGHAPDANAEALLIGHANNVCALDVDTKGQYIVSGGWDAQARIWSVGKWECDAVLEGHEGSVWAVLAYDRETIITGCADQLIRVFHTSGKLLKTIKGTGDVVRALCRLPRGHPSGADFASAGNDGIIRLWTLGGKHVAALHGHENFIYSIALLPSGEIVSSGEDRTVRVWRDEQCIQTITLPAISVWSVAACAESGDIVTGSSDRIVRVFTREAERMADAAIIQQFEESIKASSIPQQALPSINKEKLPGPEFLQQKSGTKEGQVQMIRESDGSVTAHQWSSGQQQWLNIGTVVDAVGSSGKKVDYFGKEYDYVFDVDIEDGKPALKLPYNLSQNPYEAATKFLEDNELPISYLDQVANFITTNTQGATIGQSQQQAAPAGPAGSDPWGTESRYRPGGSASTGGAPAAPPSAPKILPQKEYLSILVARYDAMQKKIEELNTTLINSGHKDLSLNPASLTVLQSTITYLSSTSTNAAVNSHTTPPPRIPAGSLELALHLLRKWPYEHRLPGLDLVRLLAPSPQLASYKSPQGKNIIQLLVECVNSEQPPRENWSMMAIRCIVNLFASSEGRALCGSQFEAVQQGLVAPCLRKETGGGGMTSNRNLLVAVATLYINYSVFFTSSSSSSEGPEGDTDMQRQTDPAQLFERVIAMLEQLVAMIREVKDSEALYRALVGLGTLLSWDNGGVAEVREAASSVYEVKKALGEAKKNGRADPRIGRIVGEVETLLK
jgi:phospholipase A-2-activating protein